MSRLLRHVSSLSNKSHLMKVRHYGAGAVKDEGGAFARKGGAEENAYFYNLQKEQLEKIKGLRKRADEKVKYEILKPSQIQMVHRMMYESGYPREPMVKHLGLCNGLFSIPDSDKLMEDLIMTYNMSLLAKDRTKNIPLGVVINGEFNRGDISPHLDDYLKKESALIDPDFAPILAMRHEVDCMGGTIAFQSLNTDTIFNTKFLMVKPDVSMQGLATGLLSRAIQQASALGYKGIKTVVSHDGFKKAAIDNGMEMVAEIKFDEFIFNGKKVFADIKDHSSCSFMAMKL